MTNQRQIPFIDLVGDVDENFYQLGLKDADAAKLSLEHIESLIKTPWQRVDSSLRFLAQSLFRGSSSWNERFSPRLHAYAEGLGIPAQRMMLAFLVPELSACLAKWLPRLPKTLFGCSSLFHLDDQGEIVHVRTLDFPLGTTFDAHERIVRTQFQNEPTIISYGSAGFPYPSLSAITSEGVSFALHQKFNDVLDTNGTPIFELVQDMLVRCGDLKTTLGFLRKSRSLTTWSFHMGFKDGQVLEADISGDVLHYKTYKLEEKNHLYFNNDLITPAKNQNEITPLNFKNYNQWRRESANRKIAILAKKNHFDLENTLKTWCSLEKKKQFSVDVLTPTSLHVVALKPTSGELHAILGEAPKTWQGQIQSETKLFEQHSHQTKITGKHKEPSDHDKTWTHLLKAQSARDLGDDHQLHHHLQMAIRKGKDTNLLPVIKLFHAYFVFLSEKHPRILSQVLNDVLELTPQLDKSFRDHAWLLISRLERVLGIGPSIVPAQISHPRLVKLLEVENAIPKKLFDLTIRGMIHPRIDLLDFIHVHERLDP